MVGAVEQSLAFGVEDLRHTNVLLPVAFYHEQEIQSESKKLTETFLERWVKNFHEYV